MNTGEIQVRTESADETRAIASAMAKGCRPGDVLLLVGDLGAGKTTFAQGFAAALGVAEQVTSPTFALMRQYSCVDGNDFGIKVLLHVDVYRMDRLQEIVDLGLGELVEEDSIALVEWGDLAAPIIGKGALTVHIESGDGAGADGVVVNETKLMSITGNGPDWLFRTIEMESILLPWSAHQS